MYTTYLLIGGLEQNQNYSNLYLNVAYHTKSELLDYTFLFFDYNTINTDINLRFINRGITTEQK